jgi:uncharacterized repeat protein (TIGR03803 family)
MHRKPDVSRTFGLCSFLLAGALGGSRPAIAQSYTVLHHLATDLSEGAQIYAPLVEGPGGFYGVASSGGANGFGTAFKITSTGTFTKLHDFTSGSDGGKPLYLVNGGDGNLYGLTAFATVAMVSYPGTFFKMTPAGAVTTLHYFAADNSEGLLDPSSLTLGSDGSFYGTAWAGGTHGYGTVYGMTFGGALAKLHDFGPYADLGGTSPAGLLLGTDMKLYGTATGGGANNLGAIFKIDGGAYSVIHSMSLADGSFPSGGGHAAAPLFQSSDGSFCGTSSEGAANAVGSAWKVTTGGVLTVLHAFLSDYGADPYAGVIEANDQNLYGSTVGGGQYGLGVLYQLTAAGSYTPFHVFLPPGTDGADPYTAPIQGADGYLYGATYGSGAGVIYKASLPPSVLTIVPSSGPAAGGTATSITGTNYVSGATVAFGGVSATAGVTNPTTIAATSPALAPGTLNDVTVTNPDTSFGTGQKAWLADFLDVPQADIFHSYVEKVFRNGITAGCSGGNYCRNNPVTRAQMAVFLLKVEHGSSYVPPSCTGVFSDVSCPSTFAAWIEELYNEGITGGCGVGIYCPNNPVTRAQMAVFLLKTEHGSSYMPPACAGIFGDVSCPSTFANWIERLYAESVTGGCQMSPLLYCPGNSVLRGQMATFLVKTFHLP